MKSFAKIFIALILLSCTVYSQTEKFQIGVYGLQPLAGTSGHQSGKLDEIKDDILMVNGTINGSIAMRSWNRDKYPNWNFNEYVANYMEDMYSLTNVKNGSAGIQILTPALYPVFTDPVIEDNENDLGNDRSIEADLLRKFIWDILEKEIEIVKKRVFYEHSAIEILLNKNSRPLGGWYLDDEPIVRNHDVGAVEEIADAIRKAEKEFFIKNEIFSKLGDSLVNNYFQNRVIAFDADDLHGYYKSGRKADGRKYNRDGKEIKLIENKRYTVFKENTFEILMPDFYHPDIRFWGKIIADINYEFTLYDRKRPSIIPIIYTDVHPEYINYFNKGYYENVLTFLNKYKTAGIWFYLWETSKDRMTLKDIWSDGKINILEKINRILK